MEENVFRLLQMKNFYMGKLDIIDKLSSSESCLKDEVVLCLEDVLKKLDEIEREEYPQYFYYFDQDPDDEFAAGILEDIEFNLILDISSYEKFLIDDVNDILYIYNHLGVILQLSEFLKYDSYCKAASKDLEKEIMELKEDLEFSDHLLPIISKYCKFDFNKFDILTAAAKIDERFKTKEKKHALIK